MTTRAKTPVTKEPVEDEPTVPPEDDPTVEDEPPVVEAKAAKAAKGGVRRSSNAWWCPIDDTSMPLSATECDACGFKP